MNVVEMKVEMHEIISQSYDPPIVSRIYAKIHEAIAEIDLADSSMVDETDWWDELTPTQQERLSVSIAETYDAEKCMDFDDFKMRNARWFNN